MVWLDYLTQHEQNSLLVTFIVSMLPIVELRGAIPIGVSLGLAPWTAMAVSVVGNMLPTPFIILFIRRVFAWLRAKSRRMSNFVERLEERAMRNKDLIYKYEIIGLVIFVGIPLPGTGAWTGALLAALMNIRIKYAIPAILAGVIIAGFLVTGLTFGFTAIFD